jgi:glycosyltransferase involved in cell wall biosynthesis
LSDTLKIGIVIPQFPGQTHLFFWNEIKELERLGVEVHLFSTRPPVKTLIAHDWSDAGAARTTYLGLGSLSDKVSATLRLPGWLSAVAKYEKTSGARKSAIMSASAAMALKMACADRGITHVHAHSAANSAMIAALCHLAGGPAYSITLHGPLVDYGPAQPFKWAHVRFGIMITKVLKKAFLETLGDAAPDRLYMGPMGVDTDIFRPEGTYQPWDGDEPLRLFTCARLNIVKGHQTVVAALELLKASGVTAHLTIAGEDDLGGTGYRKTLEEIIASSTVSDQVTLLGAVDGATVRAHIHASHAYVMASMHEPLGVAYMEAMACGRPTIGTNAGGVAELINHGIDGLLVEPKDPQALADEIMRLARDKALAEKLAVAGRERIVTGFGSNRSAEVLKGAVEEIA